LSKPGNVVVNYTSDERPVVLLAGRDDVTDIVANYLHKSFTSLIVITEDRPSRISIARRRAKRLGWSTALGQVLFVVVMMPLLRRLGRWRRREILSEAGLDDRPFQECYRVSSVNATATSSLLKDLDPVLIVVNGTRIISSHTLESVECPFINLHAGITPLYRGVHGGYWALASGRPEEVGTTVHLIDQGIDTGIVLARVYFDTSPRDSITTYPYLHLAAGLPAMESQIELVLKGEALIAAEDTQRDGSHLFTHPTIWGYLRAWLARGVR
jgi:folate-dependent phosphoribosylglycinamide formyltransferase PurN